MRVTSTPVLSEAEFTAGDRVITRLDVMRWAERFDPEWLVATVPRWTPLADEAGPDAQNLLAQAAESAAESFRYAWGLEEADALMAWLETRGLDLDGWMMAFMRDIAGRAAAPLASTVDEIDPTSLLADLAVSDVLAMPSARLAARVATWLEAGEAAEVTGTPAAPRSPLGPHAIPWSTLGVGDDDLSDVDARLDAYETAWTRAHASDLTTDALGAVARARVLEWTVLRVVVTWWQSEDAAREALWCVRDDGLPLEQVAEDAGSRATTVTWLLQEVPGALHDLLLSASPGDATEPVVGAMGWAVMMVLDKVRPTVDHPLVARMARRTLEQQVATPQLDRWVHWPRPLA